METGLEKVENKVSAEINIYSGASILKVTDDEQKKLLASFDTKEIEIRPDGIIYLPQTFWRKRLNEAFGIGQWALIPKHSTKDPDRDKLYLEGVLMVRGNYVATAVGEAEYHQDNPMQSWASVYESAKSDCITRCCKDMSIASELWQPEFIKKWVKENAVQVWREKTGKRRDGGIGSFQWRKKTSDKFYDEKGGQPADNHKTEQPAPKQATNGNAAPSEPVTTTRPPDGDTRPWLSEEGYKLTLKEINEGNIAEFDKVNTEFRMKREYRKVLTEAVELSKKLKETPVAEVSNQIRLNIATAETTEQLTVIYNNHPELHNNTKFTNLLTDKKKELVKPIK